VQWPDWCLSTRLHHAHCCRHAVLQGHTRHGCNAAAGARKVLWHNMREEPVLYINGRPYVVREADKPFQNLEYTGIDRSRVEDMEARLKRDVLDEVRRCSASGLGKTPAVARHSSSHTDGCLAQYLATGILNKVPLRLRTCCTQDRPSEHNEPRYERSGCC